MLAGNYDLPPVTGENRRPVVEEDEHSAAGAIHDDAEAAQYGFQGAVVHGIRVLESAMTPVYAAWGLDWFRGGRASMRHRRPVYEGTPLRAEISGGPEAFDIAVIDPAGEQPAVGVIYPPSAAPLALMPVPPVMPLFAEKVIAEKGAIVPGLMVVGAPVVVDEELLYRNVIEREQPYAVGEPILSASLPVQVAAMSVFDTIEYVTPGMHYSADATYRAPIRFGATLRSSGTMVNVFERNGHEYFEAQFVLADDDQVLAVVRQTVLYHMAKKGA